MTKKGDSNAQIRQENQNLAAKSKERAQNMEIPESDDKKLQLPNRPSV